MALSTNCTLSAKLIALLAQDSSPLSSRLLITPDLIIDCDVDPTDQHKSYAELQTLLHKDKACYLLTRLTPNYDWTLFTFIPDVSTTKTKMLYAASKNIIIRHLNSKCNDVNISTIEEVSEKEVARLHQDIDARTESEKGIQNEDRSISAPQRTTLSLPIGQAAESALISFSKDHDKSLLIFKVDQSKEQIELVDSRSIPVQELASQKNDDGPIYALYRYDHRNVLLYLCSPSSPARLKMIHASTLGSFVLFMQEKGVLIHRKLELDNWNDVTSTLLSSEMDPVQEERKGTFAKPKAPGRQFRK